MNDGNWNFTLVNDTVSLQYGNSFSTAWSDVDNDADLDLFITNAYNTHIAGNYFYLNNGNGTFSRQLDAITSDSLWSYGCAFGDYDNDGFEDLVVATTRDLNSIDRTDMMYHNNGNTNHWVTFTLRGISCNSMAIGARVYLYATINGTSVVQMREVSAQNGYCSQNDPRVHFGLGTAMTCDSIVIEWPDNSREQFAAISGDQFYLIVQGQGIVTDINGIASAVFTVYPNPAKDLIHVQAATAWKGGLAYVTDVNGKVLIETRLMEEESITFDLSGMNISNGMYNVTVVNGNHRYSSKIVIER
jgi:hypothetical protein